MRLLPLALLSVSTLLAPGARAQDPAPSASEQQAILDRIRASALGFSDRLQDFTCMQHNVRTVDRSGNGRHWKPLETQDIEMIYTAHKEHYKVVQIDGKPVGTGKGVKPGYFSAGGEFGSALLQIFAPGAKAQFEWEGSEISAGRRTCRFRYRVPVETTKWKMTADLDTVPMGHRGWVEADCDTGTLTHTHTESDPAFLSRHGRDMAIGAKIDIRYGPVTIGSQEFWLPQEADETVHFTVTRTRVQIQFQQYRKYDSASTITFGDPKQ